MVQTAKKTIQIEIKRQDPEINNGESYNQVYYVGVEDWFTVLDALIKIREEIDGTLSLRCACSIHMWIMCYAGKWSGKTRV